ncbi:amidohydrolase [Nocardia vulneris]|uniref:Amidohydrolase n=1 Tax=Nocardia vulneris TaxID=1141657 RepID=A0ABR4Z6F1_9NOCA|nr:amidohydrolase [Nocardia vulneris]KIA60907.1 amidohydrolase [Nocardia vulneris]
MSGRGEMADSAELHTDATVWTADESIPRATSFLVRNGIIAAVDPTTELLTGRETVVEHGGAFVLPGFGDVHTHHLVAGRADLYELSLRATDSLDAVLGAVADWAAGLEPDAWVVGGGWGSTLAEAISRQDVLHRLDRAAGGRPVLLRDDSCHNRWVSSRAMELAGIGAGPDPADGSVVRDAVTGAPAGLLIESALIPVERAYAAALGDSTARDAAGCRRAVEMLHGYGITHFQDAAASLPMLRALADLDRRGDLNAWVVTSAQINDRIFGTDPVGAALLEVAEQYRTTHHRPDFVKIFLDGVPTSRTALFLEPYLPDAEHGNAWVGESAMTSAELTGWLIEVAGRGLGAKVHCTGDGAVRMLLDAVAEIRAAGYTDTIVQLAHGEYIADTDLPRLAELKVVADLSPPLWFPGVIFEAHCHCLPRERANRMCPNRTLLDSGVLLAGGSDWPVTPSPNPWIGIQGLVTRADPTGAYPGTLGLEQALTLTEALRAYTVGVARASGLGAVTGSLTPGKSADFTVLDRDPFETDPAALIETKSVATWFAGRAVHRAAA